MNCDLVIDAAPDDLRALRRMFAERLPEKIQRLAELWRACAQEWDSGALRQLQRAAQTLAGSSATYGFDALSGAARRLERAVAALEESSDPSPSHYEALVAAYEAVQACDLAATAGDVHGLAQSAARDGRAPRRVLLFDSDHDQALLIGAQLVSFGYTVRVVEQLDELAAAVGRFEPAALVAGLDLPEGEAAGAAAVAALQHERSAPLPTIFVSLRSDFEVRLSAVRAGGSAFFTRPVDIGELVDAIDRLTGQRAAEPFRVLLVEDSPLAGALYSAALIRAGLQVRLATHPAQVLPLLDELRPDLVLLDVYMPGCSGPELAAVIRQQDRYVGLPIVFLSGETDREAQLAAIQRGGDDFLTKPIAPEHLVAAVLSRVRRARGMRALMVRDSMTGLLNRTAFEDQLRRELARARRNQTPLSLALLDLDHFKLINDRFGHATGDRAIKALARLLLQRLRRSDVVGRYGGEEFTITLPDTPGASAVGVVDEIRAAFAQLRYTAAGESFGATLSAGIVGARPGDDVATLLSLADAALYQAKAGGRNSVVLAARDEA